MRVKTMLLTAAAFTMLMSSAAFAGTWKAGADANQGKWWYDNGDGTYAANGWQWIDDNGDGVAECYYFDADGWMYADTTTPDGYQVNASGAWMENGEVKTSVAAAAPAVGWFEAAGLQVNALQNIPYDYLTKCNDLDLKTMAKLTFHDYRTVESDSSHPAKEGYVWKIVNMDILYYDVNARMYGMTYGYYFMDRNNYEALGDWDEIFTLNVNGVDYPECTTTKTSGFDAWTEDGTCTFRAEIACRVPAEYNGAIIGVFDSSIYNPDLPDNEFTVAGYMQNAWIFALD